MRTQIRAVAAATAVAIFCSFCLGAFGADVAVPPKDALAKLESWLGSSANGSSWSSYLKLNELKAELAKGDGADLAVVLATQKQLDSGATGLELEPFRTFRGVLLGWSDELIISKAGGLSEAAAAQGPYRPITAAEIAANKAALSNVAGKLDRYLNGNGANGQAWKKYLRMNDLMEQLKAQTPDLETLKTIEGLYTIDQIGLEMPVYSDVYAALDSYINAVDAGKEESAAQYSTQLKALVDELKQYASAYNDEMSTTVGSKIGWLDNMRQAAGFVRAVRQKLSMPNLHAKVSSRLVAAGIEQPVDDVTQVRDNILGTSISGTGHTRGKVDVVLVPSKDKALLETRLTGTTATRTVGYNGPATIRANGTTQISGSKRIEVSATGLIGYPAQASARTSTQITGINAGGGIATRVATNRVYEAKGQAERISANHAEAKIRGRVDQQAMQQLSKAQNDYLTKFRNPLLRRHEFPSLLSFSTTSDQLLVDALQANRFQLGAPTQAPPITVASDLSVQMHESMINNGTASLIAGMTLTEEELQKWVIETRGSLPEQLKSDEDRDPWSITFARIRPITLQMTDGGFKITIRGQRYTSGERAFRAMNVTAEYKMDIRGPGAYLVRQGELEIVPPRFASGQTSTLSAQEITLKSLLQKKFGKLFEPEIKGEGLILPGRWREAGRLDLKQLTGKDGWLVAAWIESGVPAPPEDKMVSEGRKTR